MSLHTRRALSRYYWCVTSHLWTSLSLWSGSETLEDPGCIWWPQLSVERRLSTRWCAVGTWGTLRVLNWGGAGRRMGISESFHSWPGCLWWKRLPFPRLTHVRLSERGRRRTLWNDSRAPEMGWGPSCLSNFWPEERETPSGHFSHRTGRRECVAWSRHPATLLGSGEARRESRGCRDALGWPSVSAPPWSVGACSASLPPCQEAGPCLRRPLLAALSVWEARPGQPAWQHWSGGCDSSGVLGRQLIAPEKSTHTGDFAEIIVMSPFSFPRSRC